MIRRVTPLVALLALAACGPNTKQPILPPVETSIRSEASSQEIDALWLRAERLFRAGRFAPAATHLERLTLELPSSDPRMVRARFYLGECYLGMKSHLQAVREFRRVSDETPSDPLAPDALLRAGDAFADLWRRIELDPTYANTALSTYQEVVNRYPGTQASAIAQQRVLGINDKLASKQYLTALYYIRYKADDSAILYLKDLASSYPKATVVPQALLTLITIYKRLGYTEDIRETCQYLRRFHPNAHGVESACRSAAAS
jgi:outer membrane assembly lipoprotein YfiO